MVSPKSYNIRCEEMQTRLNREKEFLIESGNYKDFENTWTAIENATTVPADLITEMTTLAESCNLPEEFVSIFAA